MPTQLSTILYISNYKESTAPNLFIGSTTCITRLNENDLIQTFNMTIFYPINPSTPCYIPKLTNGQVLSVNNCKFSLENNNEIDNIRSQTIYSTLRICEMQNRSQTLAFYDYEFFKNLQQIDTIIIDEISMISATLLSFISDIIKYSQQVKHMSY
ncbi:unnamed protein product [Rhizophagus irregularis]|nr:unnamed protein product [Rhizophagus irregularis]